MSSPAGWLLRNEEPLFSNAHVGVGLATVTAPFGQTTGHHVIRTSYQDVVALVTNDDDQVLLAWRHRFITGRWGWELPAGPQHPGEDPIAAARRVVHQQAGWATTAGRYRWTMARFPERCDHVGHLVALRADRPVANLNPEEVGELRWWPAAAVFELVDQGAVHDLFTVAARVWHRAEDAAARPTAPASGPRRSR